MTIRKQIEKGIIWSFGQTIFVKIFTLATQLVLAWILIPADFGTISIVYSITNIGAIAQQFGIIDVLINRYKSFQLWNGLARSMILVVAIATFIVINILGIAAKLIYDDATLTILVFLISISIFLRSLTALPSANCRALLKFKEISLIQIVESFTRSVSIIIFALSGFGVFSFAYGHIISAIVFYLLFWKISGLRHEFNFYLRRWKYLFSNSMFNWFFAICQRFIDQGDYLILGLFVSKNKTGLYYMAFTLSMQVIGLIANSLPQILFPSLSSIQNSIKEQSIILEKSIKLLSFIGIPFAIWQGCISASLINNFLSDDWQSTVYLVQILSFAMAFKTISWLWPVTFKAQMKYKKLATISGYFLLIFVVIVTSATYFYNEKGTAFGITLFYSIVSPLALHFGLSDYHINQFTLFLLIGKIFITVVVLFWGIYFLLSLIVDSSSLSFLYIYTIISITTYMLISSVLFKKEYLFLKHTLLKLFKVSVIK